MKIPEKLLKNVYKLNQNEIEGLISIGRQSYESFSVTDETIENIKKGILELGFETDREVLIGEGYAWPIVQLIKGKGYLAREISKRIGKPIVVVGALAKEYVPSFLRKSSKYKDLYPEESELSFIIPDLSEKKKMYEVIISKDDIYYKKR